MMKGWYNTIAFLEKPFHETECIKLVATRNLICHVIDLISILPLRDAHIDTASRSL